MPTTRWTVVRQAGDDQNTLGRDALSQLLQIYLPALKAYLTRHWRLSEADADDMLQEFVAEKVIRQRLIARADQRRGRFRGFLLSVLDNFVRERKRAARAALGYEVRHAGGIESADYDPAGASAGHANAFEVEWARRTLEQAVAIMRDDCAQNDRDDVWQVFLSRTLRPALEGVEPEGYESLVDRLGLQSPAKASNLLVTAKRSFARCLDEVLGQYTRDGQEVGEELRDLIKILGAAGAG